MGSMRFVIVALFALLSAELSAQERSDYRFGSQIEDEESSKIIEVDTTLFRMPITHSDDAYAQATRYYRTQGASRRRGLYYTTAQSIVEPAREYFFDLMEPTPRSQATIYAAQSGYRVGLSAYHSQSLNSDWVSSSSLFSQSGRDLFIEGVFRNRVSLEQRFSRRFGDHHFLTIDIGAGYSMRGLQYGSTSEVFGLTGSNFYNPSWGLYNGEVRNARVLREFDPNIALHYQRAIDYNTDLTIEADLSYDRRSNSSLGWYNATTPQPDYYRKLPSYLSEGEVKDYVTNIWRSNSVDYTQINWDELVRLNSLSSDGSAFYTLEDRVQKETSARFAVLLKEEILPRFTLTYGLEGEIEHNRYYKQMRDLLGATHLLDYDIFIDDSYNKSMPLLNNLRDEDNVVVEGDRFGYDYSQYHSVLNAVVRAQYRARRLDFDIEATVGGGSLYRQGHFEKERFPSAASYGKSTVVEESPYTLRAAVGYAHHANKYFALKLVSSRLSPLARNLYLNESAANYLSSALSGELINSIALSFRYNYPWISLSGEIYALRSRNGSSVYSLYDDLTSTMCRAVITDIGYSSYGAEVVADFRLHHDFKFSATLAAGKYYYDVDPYIELYDDYSLSAISSPISSRMSGVNIGNAPQVALTSSLTYFGVSKYIFNLSSSYAALRYEQPSIARRSERLFEQAFVNTESAAAALKQQRLDDIFDIEISASRFIWFDDNSRLSLRAVVRNLLGDGDRVIYAKESDRISLQSVDGYFSGTTMRESLYQYGSPRTVQLSVTYLF